MKLNPFEMFIVKMRSFNPTTVQIVLLYVTIVLVMLNLLTTFAGKAKTMITDEGFVLAYAPPTAGNIICLILGVIVLAILVITWENVTFVAGAILLGLMVMFLSLFIENIPNQTPVISATQTAVEATCVDEATQEEDMTFQCDGNTYQLVETEQVADPVWSSVYYEIVKAD